LQVSILIFAQPPVQVNCLNFCTTTSAGQLFEFFAQPPVQVNCLNFCTTTSAGQLFEFFSQPGQLFVFLLNHQRRSIV
jgi:hypothetical protein